MKQLNFIYQDWNREYYKLQSEETTCWYYNDLYKSRRFKMPAKLRKEKTQSSEIWARYAYKQNAEFRMQFWDGKFSYDNPSLYSEKWDELARIYNVTALLEITNQPYAYAEIKGDVFIVNFIDEHKRVYMVYSFQNHIPSIKDEFAIKRFKQDELFLVELEIFIYPNEQVDGRWENKDYVSYAFRPDGYMEITKIFDVRGEHLVEKYIAEEPVNVESNWEPYPKFGNWESIFEMKRWKEGELAEGFKYL